MNTRKKYPKEFKLDAVSLLLEQECTKAEAYRSLGINPNLIARWIQEHQADFRGNGKITPELEEIRDLRAQVKRLQMEKYILKKRRSSLPKKRNKVLVYHSAQEDLACRCDVSAFGHYPWRLLSSFKQGL
jgi:transposase